MHSGTYSNVEIRAASSLWQRNLLVWERSIWTMLSQRPEYWQQTEHSQLCLKTEYRAQQSSLSRITHQSDNWGQLTCPTKRHRKTRIKLGEEGKTSQTWCESYLCACFLTNTLWHSLHKNLVYITSSLFCSAWWRWILALNYRKQLQNTHLCV